MSNLRFDANCAIGTWPDGGPTFYDAEDLRKAMARLGITHALVRHSLGWQHHPVEGNVILEEQLLGQSPLFSLLAGIAPHHRRDGNVTRLANAAGRGQGARHMPLPHDARLPTRGVAM